MELLAKLQAFRQAAYNYLGKAHDATFELTDAVLLTRNAYSLADLSLSPVFRRRWSSIYEALQDSRPQRQKLMKLYLEQMPSSVRPILAGDHTIWPRPEAVTLQERTIEHQATSDNPLPWHRSIPQLTPGRVAQAFAGVLVAIDTPAQPPKPRGKSPGWPQGEPRSRRTRYPVVKKGFNRRKTRLKKSV